MQRRCDGKGTMGEEMDRRDPSEVRSLPPPPPEGKIHADATRSASAAALGGPAHGDTVRRLPPRRDTRLQEDVLAVILTCGDGTPLEALTHWRCRAALPFAGQYRGMDFALSNCMNSGIRRIGMVTQYKAHPLMQQLRQGWNRLWPEASESIELWPAQRCRNDDCYRGTADAAYQNIHIIREHAPTQLLVLAGDHLCRMNYARLIDEHRRRDADVTLGYMELPLSEAGHSGVLSVDADHWVRTFIEKPLTAANGHESAERALVSLGVYAFDTNSLIDLLRKDAADPGSWHDFGHDLLPAALAAGLRVLGHPFRDAATGDPGYCRDFSTVDGYWLANMDLLAERPQLNLHDPAWPIWTPQSQLPPARFTGRGIARESIVCAGCVLAGEARHSVLSAGCEVGAHTIIEDSVILPNARIGRGCRIRRAIVDAECVIPDGTVIDAGSPVTPPSYVSPSGIVLFALPAAGESADSARRGAPRA
jgi:glucose-1-phosphate adenylyltransferase